MTTLKESISLDETKPLYQHRTLHEVLFCTRNTMVSIDNGEVQCVDDTTNSIHVSKTPQIVKIDNFQVLGLAPEDAQFYTNYSEEQRKTVIRKVR